MNPIVSNWTFENRTQDVNTPAGVESSEECSCVTYVWREQRPFDILENRKRYTLSRVARCLFALNSKRFTSQIYRVDTIRFLFIIFFLKKKTVNAFRANSSESENSSGNSLADSFAVAAREIKNDFLFIYFWYIKTYTQIRMADEDISLTEDQLLDNLDDTGNGDAEFLNEVIYPAFSISKYSRPFFPFTFDGNCSDFAIAFFFLSSIRWNAHKPKKSKWPPPIQINVPSTGLYFFLLMRQIVFVIVIWHHRRRLGVVFSVASLNLLNCFVSIRRNLHLKWNSKNIFKAKLRM